MGTRAGVGISHHRNPVLAGREAADKALKSSNMKKADFVFMFASVGYDQEALLRSVREATGKAPLIGCSGEGVIAEGQSDESNFSVSVMAIESDEMKFRSALASGLKDDPGAAGASIARTLRPSIGPDAVAMFVLADGLTFNFDRFTGGLEKTLESKKFFPLFGGTAGDNWEMKRTYQYFDDQVVSDGVVAALLSGDARIAWGVNHGCVPIGGERKVTRCQGNVIYEIDGKPVLEVLKEYLVGDEIENWAKAIVNLCLGFKAPGHMKEYDEYLIRFMPAKDDAAGSITIPTEVSEGTSIWMTRRDQEKIEGGVTKMAGHIKAQLGDHDPKLVLHFDCAGRGKVVFRDQQKTDLLRKLQKGVSRDAPWMGFFTYGEIGPVGQKNCFHNYTAVVAAIY